MSRALCAATKNTEPTAEVLVQFGSALERYLNHPKCKVPQPNNEVEQIFVVLRLRVENGKSHLQIYNCFEWDISIAAERPNNLKSEHQPQLTTHRHVSTADEDTSVKGGSQFKSVKLDAEE